MEEPPSSPYINGLRLEAANLAPTMQSLVHAIAAAGLYASGTDRAELGICCDRGYVGRAHWKGRCGTPGHR
jgi:hypothetical protein